MLTAQTARLNSQITALNVQSQRLVASVDLIDATGGGHLDFVGVLQQPTVSGVLSAGQSWVALYRALSSIGRTLPRTAVSLIG